MARPKSDKTSMEEFIKAVMRAGSMQEAAATLGVSRQAVSKRLQAYKDRGVKGLPDFDGREVDVAEVQALVNTYRSTDGKRPRNRSGLIQHVRNPRHRKVARKRHPNSRRRKRPA